MVLEACPEILDFAPSEICNWRDLDRRKLKLAMKIGGEYELDRIGLRQWQKFAHAVRIDGDALFARLTSMAAQLPDELSGIVSRARHAGLQGAVIDRLSADLTERAASCRRLLGGA